MADWIESLVMFSFRFGPAEYVALMVLLLGVLVALAPVPLWKGAVMAVAGVLVGRLWSNDPAAALQRDLEGLPAPTDLPLTAIALLFGFLLPRIAQYAWRPERTPTSWPRLLYDGLLVSECIGPLLLMHGRWCPRPIALALCLAWSAGLWVYCGLGLADLPACLVALVVRVACLRLDLPWPPALYGMLLTNMLSEKLLRSLLLSRGDWTTFVTRPISASIFALTLAMLGISALVRRRCRPDVIPRRRL